jgi:hypothetical protein
MELVNAHLNILEMDLLTMITINSRILGAEPWASGMQPIITSLLNAHGNG